MPVRVGAKVLVGDEVGAPVGSGGLVGDVVGDEVGAAVGAAVGGAIGAAVGAAVGADADAIVDTGAVVVVVVGGSVAPLADLNCLPNLALLGPTKPRGVKKKKYSSRTGFPVGKDTIGGPTAIGGKDCFFLSLFKKR